MSTYLKQLNITYFAQTQFITPNLYDTGNCKLIGIHPASRLISY